MGQLDDAAANPFGKAEIVGAEHDAVLCGRRGGSFRHRRSPLSNAANSALYAPAAKDSKA